MKSLFYRVLLIVILCGFTKQVWSVETVKFDSEIKEQLTIPLDVVLNEAGNLFVLDSGTSVHAFKVDNNPQFHFKIPNPPEQTLIPAVMAFSPKGELIVGDINNNRINVFNLAGEPVFSFGSPGILPGQFKSLSGVDVDVLGFIYVSDLGHKRVQVFTPKGMYMQTIMISGAAADIAVDSRGYIYALLPRDGKIEKLSNDGKKVLEIICRTASADEIAKSTRFHVDLWGDLYLTQPGDERIVKINQDGKILIMFGSEGNTRGQFSGISGIVADASGRVYVADSGNSRVQIFKVSTEKKPLLSKLTSVPYFLEYDSNIESEEAISDLFVRPGKGIFSVSDKRGIVNVWDRPEMHVGSLGSGAGQLLKPLAVYVTLDGRIYVVDAGNNRVSIFNADGTPLYDFGKSGDKPGQFNTPQGIAVNGKGMIYIADTLNNRVQIFNQDGIYLSAIGMDSNDQKMQECQELKLPKSIAVDSKDNLYVLDADHSQVKIFDENGQCRKAIGSKGDAPGQFMKPADMTIDQNDNLYVADSASGTVQIFDSNGNFLLSFGSLGVGGGYFKEISSIAAAEGNVYVADYQNKVIQVFRYSPDGLLGRPERLYATKTAPPSPGVETNDVLRFTSARKVAYRAAVRDLTEGLGYSEDYLIRFVRIESIESLNDGHVKVTISIPKQIPKEILPFEG